MAKTAESPVNKGLSWEWQLAHDLGGLEKTAAMRSAIKGTLTNLREERGEIAADVVEAVLPTAIVSASEVMRQVACEVKNISVGELLAEVKKIGLPGGLSITEADITDYLNVFLKNAGSYGSVPSRGGVSRPPENRSTSLPDLGSLFNTLFPSGGLEYATANGFRFPVSEDPMQRTYSLRALDGLVAPTARGRILGFLAAAALTGILFHFGIESSAAGATAERVANDGSRLMAIVVVLIEYWALHGMLRRQEEATIRQMVDGNELLVKIIKAALVAIVVSTYAFDLYTTYNGLPSMGISDQIARILMTAAVSFVPEFTAAHLESEVRNALGGFRGGSAR